MIFDKLNRQYNLTVHLNDQYIDALGNPFVKKAGNDKGYMGTPMAEVTNPYTIEFNIDRSTLGSVNTAVFRIYNLGKETRDKFYKDTFESNPYRQIKFSAGYKGNMPLVFQGNILTAISYKTGCDVITEIQATDGGIATTAGFVNMNWGINASQAQVLNDLCMKVPNADIGFISPTYAEKTHTRGVVHSGSPWACIQRECNGRAYIDKELIYIMHDMECFDGDILEISSATGMIGSPKRAQFSVEGEMIFEPRIVVGQIVEIKSDINELVNGKYKVTGFTHAGVISDAVGGDCKTSFRVWLGGETLIRYQQANRFKVG